MNVRLLISSLIPRFVKDRVIHTIFLIKYHKAHNRTLQEIDETNKVRVAFIVPSLSMWKSQSIVEELQKDTRFDVKIILSPFATYSKEEQEADIRHLRDYFNSIGLPFVDYLFDGCPYKIREEFNPHILFYTQPYGDAHCKEHSNLSFQDRLLAYIPYSFWPGQESFGFDLPFHRQVWRIFYANNILLEVAKSFSLIKAKNGRVVGYPSADLFMSEKHEDRWKIKDKTHKRLIWAPHFTVDKEKAWTSHSSFFDLHVFLLEYAKMHTDTIQIAFKPHPKLKTELNLIWGEERTSRYYELWETMPNTQLETGDYVDLFMTSDALIHESGSFMVEYQYTQKPCLYVMEGFNAFYAKMNKLGQKALDIHYKGVTTDDVKSFIENVVINGDDPLKASRSVFYESQLIPPNGNTVAKNIHKELISSLSFK